MKKRVLILSSSPRRHGNSDTLCDEFLRGAREAGHDAEKIFLRDRTIYYCTGCGTCTEPGRSCPQYDDAREIIEKMVKADVIVLASPVYFYAMSAQMKTLIDRFQVYWAGHVRNDMPEQPVRKGAILMVGGAPSFPNQFLGGELVLKSLLTDLSAECLGEVCLHNSDHDSLETRPDIAQQVRELAEKMKAANAQ